MLWLSISDAVERRGAAPPYTEDVFGLPCCLLVLGVLLLPISLLLQLICLAANAHAPRRPLLHLLLWVLSVSLAALVPELLDTSERDWARNVEAWEALAAGETPATETLGTPGEDARWTLRGPEGRVVTVFRDQSVLWFKAELSRGMLSTTYAVRARAADVSEDDVARALDVRRGVRHVEGPWFTWSDD